jgi:malonate transporter and related proteins
MGTAELLLSLLFVGLVGFVAGKLHLFTETGRRALVKFVFYIATSALIIQAVLSIDIHSFDKFPRFILANTLVSIGIYLATYGVLRLLRQKYKSGASLLFTSNVANNIYIGLPLVRALYGNEGLIFAVVFLALPMTLGNLAQFYVLAKWKRHSEPLRQIWREFLRNPIVLSILVGGVLLLLGIRLPAALAEGLDFLGKSAAGLALFAIGLFLSLSSWKDFQFKRSIIATVIKLGIIPFITLLLCKYVFTLTGTPLQVSVMMSAMPSAIFCMVVANQYKFDEQATADAILLSSIAFLGTSLLWAHIL